MSFQTEKLGGHMAAAVSGIDLNHLPDPATQRALIGVLHDNLVLCIRGQTLAPTAFRDAMARFGTPHAALAARAHAGMRRGQHHLE
jgi:taurine dioxygenase